jgi:hypothetical protein
VPTKKRSPQETKTWQSKPATKRRGSSGSVALSMLRQAPQTRPGIAGGAMTPGGIDPPDSRPAPTVRPAPATGVGDPDREPQTPRSVRRGRRR